MCVCIPVVLCLKELELVLDAVARVWRCELQLLRWSLERKQFTAVNCIIQKARVAASAGHPGDGASQQFQCQEQNSGPNRCSFLNREFCNQEWIQVYCIKSSKYNLTGLIAIFKTHNLEGVSHVWSSTSPKVSELHVFGLQVSLFP